jgi:hypothetical protein
MRAMRDSLSLLKKGKAAAAGGCAATAARRKGDRVL